ncbi:ABC transporter ATP-binding protein [Kaistia dalseonensis]|uniref:Spermidine/putrescine transport system ATP-binding protein n=1 Tax=Kaistia dalseonensis TaxID=410840 RepID=A0ABU0HAM7_9HYPH|nr:ABC transporter ATP-binding protein [Kaistia dalseonensis]MCX5496730.1 ABC transporter ATP-binding protein [Kaistia dalseonensis]MDQ0439356.1 putative spermidine/putrescine transport system ATP-binding protein [Kaistia dalseonensis]
MDKLSIDHIVKRFGPSVAVDDVSLSIPTGELVCLLGPSGCGKSTVLRMVAGFEMPSAGRIAIDGEDVGTLPPNRRPTGMVFQGHALWSHMTVAQNIAFGLKLRHLPRATVNQKVAEVLELVGLKGFEHRHPGQLSGGQQQRVAIARCVVLEPKILLMDEPFSALDAHLRVRLREEVRTIQRRLGLTTVFVTHDQEEALTLADRIVVMNAGRIEQIGTPDSIYGRPGTRFVAGFIGTMNMIETRVQGGAARLGPIAIAVDAPEGPVTLAVRPEDFSLVEVGSAGSVAGVVERIIDLGAFRMADIRIDAGLVLKAQIGKGRRIAVGDTLALRPEHLILFGADGTARPAAIPIAA